MAYKEGLQSGVRKQLGFALKDISEHLPGAFIIYRADKENDELFYANHEFLHMAGYKDIDELFKLTKKSFRNPYPGREQQQIEASIWQQIDNGNKNDYIYFHLRKADGTYLSVLDHGRIVENQQYGRVFYVLFMDWADMHIRYSDKFSGINNRWCGIYKIPHHLLFLSRMPFYKSSCILTSLLSARHCFNTVIIFSPSNGFAI